MSTMASATQLGAGTPPLTRQVTLSALTSSAFSSRFKQRNPVGTLDIGLDGECANYIPPLYLPRPQHRHIVFQQTSERAFYNVGTHRAGY